MSIEEELDELFCGRKKLTIGELFETIAKVSKAMKINLTLAQNADGSFEYRFEPWEPYQPICPYARAKCSEEETK